MLQHLKLLTATRNNITDPDNIIAVEGASRHRAQQRFRIYGLLAISISIAFLFIMVGSIAMRGTSAFKQSFVQIEIELTADAIDAEKIKATRFGKFIKKSPAQ